MQFTIDDKPLSETKITPTQRKIFSFLDSQSDGKLYSSQRLAQLVGVSYTTLKGISYVCEGYVYRKKTGNLWGNQNTIIALKKYQEEADGQS